MIRPSDDMFEEEIVQAAEKIGLSTAYDGLFEAQFAFYIAAQNLMRTGGYMELKKRIPCMSDKVANALQGASVRQIRLLCSGEFSTLCQGVDDDTLIDLLIQKTDKPSGSRMVMQVLSNASRGVAA